MILESSSLQKSAGRLGLLDMSRLIAALSVVAFHYLGRPNPAWGEPVTTLFPWASEIAKYGALGVYPFFMISGFVVLMSAWGRSLPDFVASRVGRLYPAYWVAVLVTGTLVFLERGTEIGRDWANIGFTGIVANLTMLQSVLGVNPVDGVYWTLWVELKFYLLVGLLLLAGLSERRVVAFVILWPLAGAISRATGSSLLTQMLFPDQAPYFATGVVLYVIYRHGASRASVIALMFNLALMVSLSATAVQPFYAAAGSVDLSPAVTAAVVVGCTLLLALFTLTNLSKVSSRWLVLAGALTYPLYLMHQLLGWRLLQFAYPTLPRWGAFAAVVLFMLILAYLVHRLVELPLQPRIRRFVRSALTRDNVKASEPRS